MTEPTREELLKEREELLARLAEAEEALRALRSGEVDAVVVSEQDERVYTLERPEKHYRLLVEQIPHAAATLTSDGRILHGNRRFAALLDRPITALIGKPVQSFLDAESAARLSEILERCGEEQAEIGLSRPGEAAPSLHVGVTSLREGPLGTCVLLEDLTARRYVRELEEAQRALREADRKKDDFLATLAHELRNPLAPIRNALELIRLPGASADAVAWSHGVLDRQVHVMTRLLEDLLDVSRISRSKLELRKERVALRDVIAAALETSTPLFESAGHRLDVRLPDEPVLLDADPVRLAQVFSNLLNNAAKYTPRGGNACVEAHRDGDDVVVSVLDDGIGIHPDALPRVFEIFSQADTAVQHSQGGLGIGLSLAKGIVELHGGTIEARSEGPGRGSEFVVRLPAPRGAEARAPEPAEPDPDEAFSSGAGGARVLIADDDKDGADSLAQVLKLAGHAVRTAYDGRSALRIAEAWRPTVALLDLGMPDLDGTEVCRAIRAEPWGESMRLVALTGWGREEDRRRALAAGFDDHLVKPVELAPLLDALAGAETAERRRPG